MTREDSHPESYPELVSGCNVAHLDSGTGPE